jgi:hypothetical protein
MKLNLLDINKTAVKIILKNKYKYLSLFFFINIYSIIYFTANHFIDNRIGILLLPLLRVAFIVVIFRLSMTIYNITALFYFGKKPRLIEAYKLAKGNTGRYFAVNLCLGLMLLLPMIIILRNVFSYTVDNSNVVSLVAIIFFSLISIFISTTFMFISFIAIFYKRKHKEFKYSLSIFKKYPASFLILEIIINCISIFFLFFLYPKYSIVGAKLPVPYYINIIKSLLGSLISFYHSILITVIFLTLEFNKKFNHIKYLKFNINEMIIDTCSDDDIKEILLMQDSIQYFHCKNAIYPKDYYSLSETELKELLKSSLVLKLLYKKSIIAVAFASNTDSSCFINNIFVANNWQNQGYEEYMISIIEEEFRFCDQFNVYTGKEATFFHEIIEKSGYSFQKVDDESLGILIYTKYI